ncbi:FadR/GntR family transcriptional regulator [Mammaliicoccus sp. M-M47]|uniref:FadR/GntR family transcriptional regulator n=1 Tax=Mammaliicoccus sp. M-M47 TaxID=2898706 RepID=UPI001EFB8247|nr:FadR/GntR family transcriptional regulator [Mammaliicoccus sp. M-M47]
MKNASSKRLSEVIFNKLVERIKNDKYKVGDKLPSESVLAKEFEVSRYPVREALSKLASAGYIESFQGKGSFVINHDVSDTFRQHAYGRFSEKDLLDILEMRTIIEVEAAGICALRRTEEDMQLIEDAFHEYIETHQDEYALGIDPDYNFHKCIVQSTKNQYIIKTFENLQDIHVNALSYSLKLNIGMLEKRESVIHEHEMIYQAIKNQDEYNAKKAMKEHLVTMRKKLGDKRCR